jgi:predicted Fe-Mo cluster-binding NifX family protein
MGQRAIRLFGEKNVKIKTGDYDTVEEVINNLDNLDNLDEGCEH